MKISLALRLSSFGNAACLPALSLLAAMPCAAQSLVQAPPQAPPQAPSPGALNALMAAVPAADLARALALVRQTALERAPPGARIAVQAGVPDPRLHLAPCKRAEPFLPPGAQAWGRTRVGLRCAEGTVAWSIFFPVSVQAMAPALTLAMALPAGHVLRAGDLVLAETDWAAQPQPPLASDDDALGRTLARPANPGQALRAADLRRRQWFAGGDTVKLVATGQGFSISAEGLALADGLEGQRVRVQVLLRRSTGEIEKGPVLNGMPTADRLVEVGL